MTMGGHGLLARFTARFPREVPPATAVGLGLASAAFCLVLRAWLGRLFGETYPYEALVLGVALGAALGGAAGGLTAAVLMSALGGLMYGVCWLWAHRSGGDGS